MNQKNTTLKIKVKLNDGTVGVVFVNDIDSLIHSSELASVCVMDDDGNLLLINKRNVTFEEVVL